MTPPNPLIDMLRHAVVHTPYYAAQDWAKDFRKGKNIEFKDIPILPQSETKKHTDKFYSTWVPPEDGAIIEKFTSGSTGEPTRILKTAKHFHFNTLENQRLKKGWGLADHKTSVHAKSPKVDIVPDSTELEVNANGQHKWTIHSFNSKIIGNHIVQNNVTLFRGYPSVAQAVLEQFPHVELKLISTVGETISEELISLVSAKASMRLADTYGSIETGIIAHTCTFCGNYHFADRHVIAETLTKLDGHLVPEGQARVVITTLFNSAMPLIRYDIGDFVEIAKVQNCGVSRLSIKRIIGRERDQFKLLDGSKVTPSMNADDAVNLEIRRMKFVQISLSEVECRYIAKKQGQIINVDHFQNMVSARISPTLRAIPVEVSELLPGPNGKYRMHECLI